MSLDAVQRDLAVAIRQNLGWFPIVTVTGPRQSGKTTLLRSIFGDRPYVNFERIDVRQHADGDPRGFLDQYRDGAIFDEVQQSPQILSYLQAEVDERPAPGRFILSGSQQFGLLAGISQSLAGRTAVLHLLPPSWRELQRFDGAPRDLYEAMFMGAYPRIHDRKIPAARWLATYVTTYLERDVRQVLKVTDLSTFGTFLRLCAGRTAQEVNLSSLGADAGITHPTARAWLSVLETSFVCFRLPPWHRNLRARQVKTPKLHFFDTGLVCHLLGITAPEQLRNHPLRGAIFETWVASEIYKIRAHAGLPARLHHLRQTRGAEVDLVVEHGGRVRFVESKSGATVQPAWLSALRKVRDADSEHARAQTDLAVVYGGEARQRQGEVDVVPWRKVMDLEWGD